jgi:RNA polymerase sigma-70 factor (ECF subfamily)
MEALRAGDAAALDALYDRYSPFVLALCLRTIRDRAAAEEVMVDIFFELWNKSERYDPQRASPRTYLMTLARSRTIDALRSAGKQKAVPLDEKAIEGLNRQADNQKSDGGPSAAMAADEQQQRVRQAMMRLETDQRLALEASYFEGLSHAEIAEKMGLSDRAVRRAIEEVRRRLEGG